VQPVVRATGKRFDTLGGRRLETRRAGRICPDLCASRLIRSRATHGDDPLNLGPNPLRQNGSNLRLDALTGLATKLVVREADTSTQHRAVAVQDLISPRIAVKFPINASPNG